MPHSSVILITLVFIASFLVIWSLGCKVVSLLGWNSLTKLYTALSPAKGTLHSAQSITIGRFGNYTGCATLHTDARGLHLAVLPIFRISHPPLFIPWSAVRFLKENHGFLRTSFLYDLGTPRVIRIALPAEIHLAIQHHQKGPTF